MILSVRVSIHGVDLQLINRGCKGLNGGEDLRVPLELVLQITDPSETRQCYLNLDIKFKKFRKIY